MIVAPKLPEKCPNCKKLRGRKTDTTLYTNDSINIAETQQNQLLGIPYKVWLCTNCFHFVLDGKIYVGKGQ